MDDTEDMLPDSIDLFSIEINGTTVPIFDWSGKRWYQLAALFRALGLHITGTGYPASKVGNMFFESGEFQQLKYIWFGTVEGLSLFADHLRECRLTLTTSRDREVASIRFRILSQWLSDVSKEPLEPSDPEDDENSPWPEDGSANDTPSSAEAATEGNVPPDAVQDAEAAMCAAKSQMVSDGPVARAMMDNLLARVDSLCGVFGIDRSLPRDEKLVHIVWLLVFHGHDSVDSLLRILNAANRSVSSDLHDAAEGIMEPEIFLLWCKQWSHVEDLVKAAMMA